MNTPIKTVNRHALVTISPKVHQVVENKLTKNFTAMPWMYARFLQTVEWLRKYCWELNNIAGTSDFSEYPRTPNGNYIWECDNNMGKLILQVIHSTSNTIVVVIDEDLTSRVSPFTLVEHKYKKGEKRTTIRLTENQFKNFLSGCIKDVLNEVIEKDSFQAKPKKEGRLNDWEINNIFGRIVSELVCSKRITPEDGEMLLYYGLYNNDCVSHIGS